MNIGDPGFWASTVFPWLFKMINAAIVGFAGLAILSLFILALVITFVEADGAERIFRSLSILFAMLLYWSSQALGMAMPDLLLSSFSSFNTWLTSFLALTIGIGIGGTIHFVILRMELSSDKLLRIIIAAIMFVFLLLSEVFSIRIREVQNVVKPSLELLPNILFVVGLVGYIILCVDSTKLMVQLRNREVEGERISPKSGGTA